MTELYILPFDHRGSFMKMIKAQSPPSDADVEKARKYKGLIYKAFEKSVEEGVPKDSAGILVDEWLGTNVINSAKKGGFIHAVPFEKSGQEEFDFEYDNWQEKISQLEPTYVKVLVRYNPEGDKSLNETQAKRLSELSKFLKDKKSDLLFELLVPPLQAQLDAAGSTDVFEQESRPDLMVQAIKELQEAGVDPAIWKLEGLDSTEKMQMVADQVTSFNSSAGIIILGRGESAAKAEHWLRQGAQVSSAFGFAVGRTIFKEPIEQLDQGKISEDEAIDNIKSNFTFFVDVWKKVKSDM